MYFKSFHRILHSVTCAKLNSKCFSLISVRLCKSYTKTILLPQTKFPAKISFEDRQQWDSTIRQEAKFDELYLWQKQNSKGGIKVYVLHDGPPYANGQVHLGHAINKILKDIIVRFKILQGFQVHYVPGWDCHGLPIELKAVKDGEKLSFLDIRKKSQEFAMETSQKQKEEFISWGLIADWDNVYFTSRPEYIAKQLKAFYTCYEKGLIYHGYKPVYWSPSSKTALAEAELEYHDHVSKSVYIEFSIKTVSENLLKALDGKNASVLCWTTTPWSLPANQAVCFAANKDYAIVEERGMKKIWIVALETIDNLQKVLNKELKVLQTFEGDALTGCTYLNPMSPESELPFLKGNHVTMEKGTGLVHTAPNHGLEDYATIVENGISIQKCLVDEEGKFTATAGKDLVGKEVLGDGTRAVLELLKNNLVHLEDYQHSYPYDWRTNKPVILRASRQWFMRIKTIEDQAVSSLDKVQFYPTLAKDMLKSSIQSRPDWCISRQRSWGVPIPAFYMGREKQLVVNKHIIEHLCHLVQNEGIHFWWSSTIERLLPQEVLTKSGLPLHESYTVSEDILDIWFDSGISWHAVLPEPQISDAYLEGLDQIRGWFQSSLLTSIALRGCAPYRSVYMHGFALDKESRKMSKSLGNITEPSTIIEGKKGSIPAYGVDALRWWVAYQGSGHKNTPVDHGDFADIEQYLFKVRKILRFMLGSLRDYDHILHQCSFNDMKIVDKYMLHRLAIFCDAMTDLYNQLKFNLVANKVSHFVTNDLSALYFSVIKDRLYCDKESSLARRSCQTVLFHIFENLVKAIGPIIPHLAEEAYSHHHKNECSVRGVFKNGWLEIESVWKQHELYENIEMALQVRGALLSLPQNIRLRDMDVFLVTSEDAISLLKSLHNELPENSDLCELLQVANVTLMTQQPELASDLVAVKDVTLQLQGPTETQCKLLLQSSKNELCARCRRRIATGKLCSRCLTVLEVLKNP